MMSLARRNERLMKEVHVLAGKAAERAFAPQAEILARPLLLLRQGQEQGRGQQLGMSLH